MNYTVHVGYDEADNTYFVLSSDIPGLNVETQSFETFVEVTQDALPDLVGDEAVGSQINFQQRSKAYPIHGDCMDRETLRTAANDEQSVAVRTTVARFTADTFRDAGSELHLIGHIIGEDRIDGESPFGHGNDATVAISMLLRIGSQLVSGSADLINDGRHYAGSALIRQLVEVEYLAWAFETKNEEAARWLRSTRKERKNFFTPAKLRAAAGSHFRSVDYGYHCELGGHPVPGSWSLLKDDKAVGQLMLSDCLGHSGRIWDHVVGWAKLNTYGAPIAARSREMSKRFAHWKQVDLLTSLPPPEPPSAEQDD